jgi:SWI/SNF-related matrix-associated actin-dependent regulator 1 of chromatin subfamily A
MVLTFKEQNFVLSWHPSDAVRPEVDAATWIQLAPTCYTTKNVNAAARFKQLADDKAKRVFEKHCLKNYVVPSCGPIVPPEMELFDFQATKGIPHILRTNRTYLAHEPGLGKTAQAVCAVNTKPGSTLVIVPSFLRYTWAREITKWAVPSFPNIAIVPESKARSKMDWSAEYIICSDSMLQKPWVLFELEKRNFRFIFIDEAHRFKTPDANRTIALFGGKNGTIMSRGLIYEAEHVCALSGTPMLNRPIELWPVARAMAPETIDFMGYLQFGYRYCGARMDDRGRVQFLGSNREEELHQRLTSRFMQRLRKADVLKDLPQKIREVLVVDKDMRKKEVVKLDEKISVRAIGQNFENLSLGEYAELRHELGLSKIPFASNFVLNTLQFDEEEQVILFAWHKDVVEQLAENLSMFKPGIINGGVSIEKRTKIEDDFQSGRTRLIIGNISAMNLGLTLTRATRVVFVEYDWTPSANEQAEDRANRIGSEWSVYCQYITIPSSFDEVMLNSVLRKQKIFNKVIEGE